MRDDIEPPAYQGRPDRGWVGQTRRVVVVCGVVIAMAAATAGVRRLLGAPDPVAGSNRSVTGYGCLFFGSDPGPDRECGPPAGLDPRRSPVTDGQRLAVEDTAKSIRRAASNAGWCMTGSDPECGRSPRRHKPTEEDVDAARAWLARTGASASTARLARPGDPGFVGALLYAARVGEVCVIGYLEEVPGGAGGKEIVGILPDGSCLPD